MPTQKLTAEILNAAIEGLEAQKRRIDAQIAEVRQVLEGGQPTPEPTATPQPERRKTRKLSAAGRAAIVAALQKRWAEKKAAEQKAEPSVVKAVGKKVAAKKTTVKKAAVKASVKVAA